MASTNKTVAMVTASEQDQISRLLLSWLNEYPNKPVTVINYEFLEDDKPSMALSTIQGAYKTRRYITGGYEAAYEFKVIYRTQPGNSNNNRLKVDELLDSLADWSTSRADVPVLGEGIRFRRLETNSRSSLFARYENGDEDHQILMTMTYEVI